MNFKNEKICGICLKTECQNNYEEIDEITKEMLDVLLLKLNLSVSKKPMMCYDCGKNLRKFFDFKCMCLYTEDILYPLISSNDKLDLKDVYLKQNNVKVADISQDQKICRLCVTLVETGSFKPLKEMVENMFIIEDALQKYIPELNLNVTEEPVICISCLSSLQNLFSFMTKEMGSNLIVPKVEDCSKTDKRIAEKSTKENTLEAKGSSESFMGAGVLEISIKKEEIEIKSELSDCESLEDITPASSDLKQRSKISATWKKTFKCKSCSYKTIRKHHLKRHLLVHTDPSKITMYKCQMCTFETKHEGYVKKHMLCHRDPSKIMIYKCEHCTFKSKREEVYRKHLLYHTNPSEVKIFKCQICDYTTLYKNTFEYHILTHKDASEVTMLKCQMCTFESKHRQILYRHKLIHRDPSEITRFECDICDFKAKSKKGIKKHMITHKDPSEVTMFQCRICAYQSKYKHAVKKHEIIHKDFSEVTMFQCDVCTYETKLKDSFYRHKQTHKKEKH